MLSHTSCMRHRLAQRRYSGADGVMRGVVCCRLQLAEIKNGRLAMIAIGGIVHHYLLTGKGPVQLLTGA